ncbi:hypothetical protein EJB05_22660, partial [Eragrostis curvula]
GRTRSRGSSASPRPPFDLRGEDASGVAAAARSTFRPFRRLVHPSRVPFRPRTGTATPRPLRRGHPGEIGRAQPWAQAAAPSFTVHVPGELHRALLSSSYPSQVTVTRGNIRMDPNDGSQGGFPEGNMGPYQGGWNQYMFGYQGQPSWIPQGRPQVPQGMPQLPPNFSMMYPSTNGPQVCQPAENENASRQPDENDVHEPAVSAEPSPTGKRSSAAIRTKLGNFTPEEDVNLVKSCLEIQGDQITNTSQKKEKMWLRILEQYNLRRGASPVRSSMSLQSRWDTIKAEAAKFASYYADVLRENRSGMSDAHKVCDLLTRIPSIVLLPLLANGTFELTTQAAATFAAILKHQFSYLHCWELMKDEPRWQDAKSRANSKSAAGEGFGDDNINLGDGNCSPTRVAETRPMGRDQAKAAKKAANSSVGGGGGGGGSASSSEYASRMEDLSLQKISIMQTESDRKVERFQQLDRIDEKRYEEMRSHNAALLAIEQEKLQFKRQQYDKEQEDKEKQEDERILAIDLDDPTLTPAQRLYYKDLQDDILLKMSARRRKRHSPAN